MAESLNNLGGARTMPGKLRRGRGPLQARLSRSSEPWGEARLVATTLGNLAVMRYRKGDSSGAETLLREQIALQRKVLGSDHPELAAAIEMLATVLDTEGDYEAAERLHRETLALQQRLLGPEHPEIELTTVNLAATSSTRGSSTRPSRCTESAWPSRGSSSEREHRRRGGPGRPRPGRRGPRAPAEAEAHWREALSKRTKAQGSEHSDTAEASGASRGRCAGEVRSERPRSPTAGP